jgi:hypothetical protein
VQLGGPEVDGVRGLAAVGQAVVVGGFYSGTMRLGQHRLTAGGGDDAYLAAFVHGELVERWAVTGPGREEIASLAAIPGGFIAGVTHTARAEVAGSQLPSPNDPAAGAALVIRAMR